MTTPSLRRLQRGSRMLGNAFSWIDDRVRWLGELVPRWDLCRPTHTGVKFLPGNKVKRIKPGRIYWWWPVTTVPKIVQAVRLPVALEPQSVMTRDFHTVLVSPILTVSVLDPERALTMTDEVADVASDIAASEIAALVGAVSLDRLAQDMREGTFTKKMREVLQHELKEYGLGVVIAGLSDFCEHTVIRTIGQTQMLPQPEEEDEEE